MSASPMLNITMPVFNRFHLTQKTILGLRRCSRAVPFSLTVVDNGSDAALVARLKEFRKTGLIDKLFLLPENMGISCAANIGWRMTDAPYYMKLDNDILIKDPDWLPRLFALWSHGQPLSTLGPAWDESTLLANPGSIPAKEGVLGICTTNLQGQAIIIPKAVSDLLGCWSEDYGLYGAEDGDYGMRMVCAGFPQYYYAAWEMLEDMGLGDLAETYAARNIDRTREHSSLFVDERGGVGLFRLNYYLFHHCIRVWRVPPRYAVTDVDADGVTRVEEREEYKPVRHALLRCKELVDKTLAGRGPGALYEVDFIERLKDIMARCGQADFASLGK